MDIKIRTARIINNDLYKEMLNDIKIYDTERIINEGCMDYECDYFTIYYHEKSKCVGLYNITHCSCESTEDPDNFDTESFTIVDTIEDFYKKCIENKVDIIHEIKQSYICWFEDNYT